MLDWAIVTLRFLQAFTRFDKPDMCPDLSAFSIHEFLTVSQAAELLGVTATTLRNWDKSGKLTPVRHPLNGYRLYDRADLEALMRQFSPDGKEAQ